MGQAWRSAGRPPRLFAGWGARLIDLWQGVYLDRAADANVRQTLDSGGSYAALERDLEAEARRFGEWLSRQVEFGEFSRKTLAETVASIEAGTKDALDQAPLVPFHKALREGFSLERVAPKVPKVTETELRGVLGKALTRARGL